MLDHRDLNSYLHYGYLPRCHSNLLEAVSKDVSGFLQLRSRMERLSNASRMDMGARVLASAFERSLESTRTWHVVPISGGMDSRAILCHLLKAGLGSQIICVTYGAPGSLDFEIGKIVARDAGVRHEILDLTSIQVRRDDLDFAFRTGAEWTCLVTGYYNRLAFRMFGQDAEFWSGFMGDHLAGSSFEPWYRSVTWGNAKTIFARKNAALKQNLRLTHPAFTPESALPDEPLLDSSVISYTDQLDFSVRQPSWIWRTTIGSQKPIRVPFADPEWIRFMLAQPDKVRHESRFYSALLLNRFPELFSLPLKGLNGGRLGEGWWIRNLRRGISAARRIFSAEFHRALIRSRENYIDFDAAYRMRSDFVELAATYLPRLARAKLLGWLDLEALLRKHMSGQANCGLAIQLLVSLQINLENDAQTGAALPGGTH